MLLFWANTGINYQIMRISLFLLAILCSLSQLAIAQIQHQSTGWLFLMNNTKINKKMGHSPRCPIEVFRSVFSIEKFHVQTRAYLFYQ
jgi:hypothetical protein